MIRLIQIALASQTRLPIQIKGDVSDSELAKSSVYFTWVGMFIGIITGIAYILLSYFFDPGISWILVMGLVLFLTRSNPWSTSQDDTELFHQFKSQNLRTLLPIALWFLLTAKWYTLRNLSVYNSTEDLMIIWIGTQVISRAYSLIYSRKVATALVASRTQDQLNNWTHSQWLLALAPAIIMVATLWTLNQSFQWLCALLFPMFVIQFLKRKPLDRVFGTSGSPALEVHSITELAILLGFLISWP